MLSFQKVALLLGLLSSGEAFSSISKRNSPIQQQQQQTHSYDPLNLSSDTTLLAKQIDSSDSSINTNNKSIWIALAATSTTVASCPSMANAATAFTNNGIPSALAAYGHYAALIGLVGCTMVERLTIKPGMSEEDEKLIMIADSGLGIFGVLITYTGYLRATQFEKGWDFYSHEPIFWLKMGLLVVYGASTFFNTTTIIKRAVEKQSKGSVPPVSEKLATRMKKLCNAGIVGLALIPASATVMARGIGYNADIPWQAEAALVALLFGGLGFKYIKEALEFDNGSSMEPVSD